MDNTTYDSYTMLIQSMKYIEQEMSAQQLDLLRLMLVLSNERNPVLLSLITASGFTLEDINNSVFLVEVDEAYFSKSHFLDAAGLLLSDVDIQSVFCQNVLNYLIDFDYYKALYGKISYKDCHELNNSLNLITFFAREKHESLYRLCERISAILEELGDDSISLAYGVMWEYENHIGNYDVNRRIRQYYETGYIDMAEQLMNLGENIDSKTKASALCAKIENFNSAVSLPYVYNSLGDSLLNDPSNVHEYFRCAMKLIDLKNDIALHIDILEGRLPASIKLLSNAPARIRTAFQLETLKEGKTEDGLVNYLEKLKAYFDEGLKYGLAYNIIPLLRAAPRLRAGETHLTLTQFYEGLISFFKSKKGGNNSGYMGVILRETNKQYASMLISCAQSGEALARACKGLYESKYDLDSYSGRKYFRDANSLILSAIKLCENKNEHSTLLSLLLIEYKIMVYCSPEQAFKKKLGIETDIWSFALLVIEMLLKKRPWYYGFKANEEMDSHWAVIRETYRSSALVNLLRTCLCVNPVERPRGFFEIEKQLISIYEDKLERDYPRIDINIDIMNAEALYNHASSYLALGDKEKAENLFDQALIASPDDSELYSKILSKREICSLGLNQVSNLYKFSDSKFKSVDKYYGNKNYPYIFTEYVFSSDSIPNHSSETLHYYSAFPPPDYAFRLYLCSKNEVKLLPRADCRFWGTQAHFRQEITAGTYTITDRLSGKILYETTSSAEFIFRAGNLIYTDAYIYNCADKTFIALPFLSEHIIWMDISADNSYALILFKNKQFLQWDFTSNKLVSSWVTEQANRYRLEKIKIDGNMLFIFGAEGKDSCVILSMNEQRIHKCRFPVFFACSDGDFVMAVNATAFYLWKPFDSSFPLQCIDEHFGNILAYNFSIQQITDENIVVSVRTALFSFKPEHLRDQTVTFTPTKTADMYPPYYTKRLLAFRKVYFQNELKMCKAVNDRNIPELLSCYNQLKEYDGFYQFSGALKYNHILSSYCAKKSLRGIYKIKKEYFPKNSHDFPIVGFLEHDMLWHVNNDKIEILRLAADVSIIEISSNEVYSIEELPYIKSLDKDRIIIIDKYSIRKLWLHENGATIEHMRIVLNRNSEVYPLNNDALLVLVEHFHSSSFVTLLNTELIQLWKTVVPSWITSSFDYKDITFFTDENHLYFDNGFTLFQYDVSSGTLLKFLQYDNIVTNGEKRTSEVREPHNYNCTDSNFVRRFFSQKEEYERREQPVFSDLSTFLNHDYGVNCLSISDTQINIVSADGTVTIHDIPYAKHDVQYSVSDDMCTLYLFSEYTRELSYWYIDWDYEHIRQTELKEGEMSVLTVDRDLKTTKGPITTERD